MNTKPQIILVDDHDLFRDGIKMLIEHNDLGNIIGEARDGVEFLELLADHKPDLVILDIAMPNMNGIEAATKARLQYPDLKIMALSMFGEQEYYMKMLDVGVKSFVLKSSGKNEFEQAIKQTLKGKPYISTELLTSIMKNMGATQNASSKSTKQEKLTPREIDTLKGICRGLTVNEISTELHISPKTIEGYRTKLLSKTDTKNSVSLVLYALKNELVDFDNLI